jgi:hypothetical protein
MIPSRVLLVVFSVALYVTAPVPVPDAPDRMVSHPLPERTLAAHEQPVGAVTVKEPGWAEEARFALSGVREIEQGAPVWVTAKGFAPIVTVPFLVEDPVYAGTATVTVPLPFLKLWSDAVIHESDATTAGLGQFCAPVAATVTCVVPPRVEKVLLVGEIV